RVDSTNRHLLSEAARGGGEGIVAVADEQTAGRGRHGRTWSAAPGAALLVSVLLRPDLPPERLPLVTLAAGIAAAEAVQESGALDDAVAAAAARSATLGRRVRVELALDAFDGVATGMTPEGYLVVARDDGREQIVTAGDVVHLRAG